MIKFCFDDYSILWFLDEKHIVDDKIKIILNPIPDTKEIFVILSYDTKGNLLGVKDDDKLIWYKIDYQQRLLKYYDSKNKIRYLYYQFIDEEQSVK